MECESCGQEMKDQVSCTLQVYSDTPDVPRLPYPEDSDGNCHDCLTPPGGLHHPGCDMERCPRCHGQLITCRCPAIVKDSLTAESPS